MHFIRKDHARVHLWQPIRSQSIDRRSSIMSALVSECRVRFLRSIRAYSGVVWNNIFRYFEPSLPRTRAMVEKKALNISRGLG